MVMFEENSPQFGLATVGGVDWVLFVLVPSLPVSHSHIPIEHFNIGHSLPVQVLVSFNEGQVLVQDGSWVMVRVLVWTPGPHSAEQVLHCPHFDTLH